MENRQTEFERAMPSSLVCRKRHIFNTVQLRLDTFRDSYLPSPNYTLHPNPSLYLFPLVKTTSSPLSPAHPTVFPTQYPTYAPSNHPRPRLPLPDPRASPLPYTARKHRYATHPSTHTRTHRTKNRLINRNNLPQPPAIKTSGK
ncbi:hypothetical protein K440DRAFT_625546 [Wilcoxina mikolae CBS 423.85]|nr:hypothetical protein K440DRAFT_625546 [Wilcoxina mikolae CBS 423.85]